MTNYSKYWHSSDTVPMYGITEKKKAELDALVLKILDAQHDVGQFQAMADSLSSKLSKMQVAVSDAEGRLNGTLSNRNMTDQLLQQTIDLLSNAKITFTETGRADDNAGNLAGLIKIVIDKLIYTADIINKLAGIIVRNKSRNPLISDELVNMCSKAGTDANNTVALTLTALQSIFAAHASLRETNAAMSLTYHDAMELYNLLTGNAITDAAMANDEPPAENNTSLRGLLYKAYADAKNNYDSAQKACIRTGRQLNHVQSLLNKAQVKLQSLQSALSAGQAAALAS